MIIAGRTLEYIDEGHIYLVDGVIVPSITQLLKRKFGGMYNNVSPDVLNKAAERGNNVHAQIERYVNEGEWEDGDEIRGYRWLEKQYGFHSEDCEVPLILFDKGEPIAAGRCDLILEMDGKIGGADVKTTSTLQKEYVAYQLNLYNRAYLASYGIKWEFIWAIHLRGLKRKIQPIPIDETAVDKFIKEYVYEYRDVNREDN